MEANMKRCIDLIGIAGFVILVISTLLLFPHSAEQMTWTYWLAGLVLWFMAFVFLVGWLILRWSIRRSHQGPQPLLVWSRPSTKEDVAAAVNGKVQKQAA
jgi:membrane-bound ClpP family serine protease